jgi:hypothetical protein
VQAVFRAEAQQHGLPPEKNNRQLGVSVLEREVDVPGGGGAEVGNLALHPDVAVLLLDEFADLRNQLAHRPDAAGRPGFLEGKAKLWREWVGRVHPLQSVNGIPEPWPVNLNARESAAL